MKKNIHIISHSHWDREWYMPFEYRVAYKSAFLLCTHFLYLSDAKILTKSANVHYNVFEEDCRKGGNVPKVYVRMHIL